MKVTIYHNPNCSKSRAVLALLEKLKITPVVIDYLENPLSQEQIAALAQAAELPLIALLRTDDALFTELGLNAETSDKELLDAVTQYPTLLNRPIVQTEKRTQLCRPPELVLNLIK